MGQALNNQDAADLPHFAIIGIIVRVKYSCISLWIIADCLEKGVELLATSGNV
jgi:hypothetical protein